MKARTPAAEAAESRTPDLFYISVVKSTYVPPGISTAFLSANNSHTLAALGL